MLSTLRALWQADGAFPSGSFAFSYGIEGVLALRQGIDTDEFASLLTAVLRHRWATYDRIALLRSFRADGDLAAIAVVDREVEASTLVQPLRDCSRRNGASFLASHARLGTVLAGELRDAVRAGELLGHIPVMQGAVWSAIELDEKLAQLTSGYSVASGLVTAAVRLGAIGALEAQRVLGACLPLIEQLSADPVQAVFPDGTKLVTVHEPIRPAPGAAADPEHPGLVEALAGGIELNEGRRSTKLVAVNTGDRPIQIGSHFHFFEVNKALEFDRAAAFNMRLDIPARTA